MIDQIALTSTAPRSAPTDGCPVCRHPDATPLFTLTDRLVHTAGKHCYRRCTRCLTAYQDPQVLPEDLDGCYPPTYDALRDRPSLAKVKSDSRPAPSLRNRLRSSVRSAVEGRSGQGLMAVIGRALAVVPAVRGRAYYDLLPDELLPRRAVPGRALDVGCGRGTLVSGLAAAGWEAEGLERDLTVANLARESTGRPVHCGDLATTPLVENTYDLIVLRHVFEHIGNPAVTLNRISRLLAPGGQVVLYLPNSESLGARWFGPDWFAWDPPRHLCLPSLSSFGALSESAGLKVIESRTTNRGGTYIYAASRALRANVPMDRVRAPVGAQDRIMTFVTTALLILGFEVGEEIAITLGKPTS